MSKLKAKPKSKKIGKDPVTAALVLQAQQGSQDAKEKLLKNYEFFLFKYKQALKSESDFLRLSLQYKDIKSFLALFTGIGIASAVRSTSQRGSAYEIVNRKINEVCEMVKEIGLDDIDTIINISFLESVQRYDPKGKVKKELMKEGVKYDSLSKSKKREYDKLYPEVGFEGFILNYFKFRLKKNLDLETKGIVPGIGWCKAYSSEDDTGLTVAEKAKDDDYRELEDLLDINEIDYDWVSGNSSNWPFSELTIQERWLVKAKFVDKRFSSEISKSIGVSPSIVRNRIIELKFKLQRIIEKS